MGLASQFVYSLESLSLLLLHVQLNYFDSELLIISVFLNKPEVGNNTNKTTKWDFQM